MYIYGPHHPDRLGLERNGFSGNGSDRLGQPVIPGRLRTVPRILSDAEVRRAVAENDVLRARLGWDNLEDAITGWIFRLDVCPGPQLFAQAVANHQRERGLPVNGILDFNTWFDMLCKAKNGIPLRFQTKEGVDRPVGLTSIVATFGNPTTRGWERTSLAEVVAPAGQKFTATKATTRVHVRLQPHFERLFGDIQAAGLWNEIYPSSGTYYCRTKARYGKKACRARGVRFDQLSTHSWGITIDIRASDYPRYTSAMQRAGRRLKYPPVTITRIFQAHGFYWGLWFMDGELDARGRINYTDADPMHFQFATGY